MTAQTTAEEHGEHLTVPERIVVAPAVGTFRPGRASAGAVVGSGDIVGTVESLGTSTAVRSAFAGTVVGLLAAHGERVHEGQPVAWLRTV